MDKVLLSYRQSGPLGWERNLGDEWAFIFEVEIRRFDEQGNLAKELKARMFDNHGEGWQIIDSNGEVIRFAEDDPLFKGLDLDECLSKLDSFAEEVVGMAGDILNGVYMQNNRVVQELVQVDSGKQWFLFWEPLTFTKPVYDTIQKAQKFVTDYLTHSGLGCKDLSSVLPIDKVRELYKELTGVVKNLSLESRI